MWKKLSPKYRMLIFGATVALMLFVIILLFVGVFSFLTRDSKENGTLLFTYGVGTKRDLSIEVDAACYRPNGIPYVNFTRVSNACGFSQSGTEDEIRYIIETPDKTFDTVTFYFNSRKATVNGMHITLPSTVNYIDGTVMIPADFITLYMNGMTVEVTEARIRVIYEEGRIFLNSVLHPLSPIKAE